MSFVTVSLQVPYAQSEQQFLILAVQAAVRTFRGMNAHSSGQTILLSSVEGSDPSHSASMRIQEALTEG